MRFFRSQFASKNSHFLFLNTAVLLLGHANFNRYDSNIFYKRLQPVCFAKKKKNTLIFVQSASASLLQFLYSCGKIPRIPCNTVKTFVPGRQRAETHPSRLRRRQHLSTRGHKKPQPPEEKGLRPVKAAFFKRKQPPGRENQAAVLRRISLKGELIPVKIKVTFITAPADGAGG